MSANRPILLAAGGTGGHLFPAIATATTLIARGRRIVLMTDARGAAYPGRPDDLETCVIAAGGPVGGWLAKLVGAAKLSVGAAQALALFARWRPAAAGGFGGYAAFPAIAAAQLTRTPYLLHESNAVLGRANRSFAVGARRLATTFAETVGATGDKGLIVGAPVRAAIAAVPPFAAPVGEERLRVLVTGGSQGARIFADVVPPALTGLPRRARGRIGIAQQARPEDLDRVRAAYAACPEIDAEVAPFFDDMPARLAAAHLAITRSGASTCAELAAAGRPSILVPYGYAMDDHQAANAAQVEAAGAAIAATARPSGYLPQAPGFTCAWLTATLSAFISESAPLAAMAAAARARATPDAAEKLGEALVEIS